MKIFSCLESNRQRLDGAPCFLMRTIGGYVFGHFGDRIGRSKMLLFTVLGMTFPTVLIGILPSYNMTDIAAPLLLLIARLVRGFVIGGEYTGALLFIAQDAPAHRRGSIASLAMMSAMSRLLLGIFAATFMTSITIKKPLPMGMASSLVILNYFRLHWLSLKTFHGRNQNFSSISP